MSIAVGDRIPSATVRVVADDGAEAVDIATLFAGRKAVLFAVPGAFTPTCSARHLPGFLDDSEALKARGVEAVYCLSVNDPFVMRAWAEKTGVAGRVTMLADGSADFVKAAGLEADMSDRGFGIRSRRFALIAEDGRITHLAIDPSGQFGASSSTAILAALG
jgi:glutaredoxin/glutathione-dependent peroxiredoxin